VPLFADLPQAVAPRPRQPSEPVRWAPVIPIAILLVGIWALTGAGYFWPMWPIGAVLLASLASGGHGCQPHRRPYSPAE
jgi:fatty acid desaturase